MTGGMAPERALLSAPELASYVAAAADGRLAMPRCVACGHVQWPPRPRCGRCGGELFEVVDVPMRGRLFSWTTTHRAPLPAFVDRVPYTVVIVTLDGVGDAHQVRVVGRWEQSGIVPDLRQDDPVTGRVETDAAGYPILLWRHRD